MPKLVKPNDASHVEWLKQNAISLQSISPDQTDFSDLAPLKRVLGDVRVVQLGEQSHGDGECFLAKARFVKFLHQQMGFDVLAMESGFYDCKESWKAFQIGKPSHAAAEMGIFSIWSGSQQTAALWDYLSEKAATNAPLELVGFDCQFTGTASRESLVDSIVTLAKKLNLSLDQSSIDAFSSNLQYAIEGQSQACRFEPVLDLLQKLLIALQEANHGLTEAEQSYCVQLLKSSIAQLRQMQDSSTLGITSKVNARDAQMADNLLWYVRANPNRKVIVWAASFHLSRNLQDVRPFDKSINYENTIPMGQIVHEALGQNCYSIGFTAYDGTVGTWFRKSSQLEPAPTGTLESECNQAGLVNALIPLRGLAQDCWLNRHVTARPLGYAWMEATWPKHFDAMFFQRTMTPSTSR